MNNIIQVKKVIPVINKNGQGTAVEVNDFIPYAELEKYRQTKLKEFKEKNPEMKVEEIHLLFKAQ